MASDNATMSDAISFYVKFDGPALSTSEMDVRSLAPALLAMADAVDGANLEHRQQREFRGWDHRVGRRDLLDARL